MADNSDFAGDLIEDWTARNIQARVQYTPAEDCVDCGDELEAHRVPYGRCICCAENLERRMQR